MEEKPAQPSTRKWLVPSIGLGLVVALSIIALTRQPVSLDPDTPAGTLQAYLQAIADKDYSAALGHLDAKLQADCSVSEISSNVYYDNFTATLGDVEESGTEATVQASIQEGTGGFGDPGYPGYFETFELVKEADGWSITANPWPYFSYGCSP